MKKHLTLLALLFVTLFMNAQTIPNGDFESWTAGEPDSWFTYNAMTALMGISTTPVTQESPAPSGNYYLKATTIYSPLVGGSLPGIALLGNFDAISATGSFGIPFTETPAFFNGSYKHDLLASTDSMLIVCQLTKWDAASNSQTVVGSAFVLNFVNAVPNWTSFSSPIIYETTDIPDSLTIGIASIGTEGASASIDNLSFSSTGSSVGNMKLSENSILLFPNPATDNTLLILSGLEEHLSQGVKIEVIDLSGRILQTHSFIRNHSYQLNTSNLESGKYLIRISNENISISKSLIIQ